jgi:penicillin amidase
MLLANTSKNGGKTKHGWKKLTVRSVAVLPGPVVLMLLAAWLVLRASLPQLDGKQQAAGLPHEVRIGRDASGVPLITGATRPDVAYATGFVHAQDRFFQTNLLRRPAAAGAGDVGTAQYGGRRAEQIRSVPA